MFDLGDVSLETERTITARGAWLALKVVLLALSAATTAMFFYVFSGGVFAELAGSASPAVAALVGVVVLDGGAVVWSYLRSSHASTIPQMAVANVTAWCDLAGSLLTSALFLTLRSGFEVGIYDAAGNLTQLGQTLHYIGLGVIVAGVAGNFLAMFVYSGADTAVRQATQQRQMQSLAAGAKFTADQARLQLTTRAALAEISGALPDLATMQGKQISGAYLATNMPVARGRGNLAPVVYDMGDSSTKAGAAAVPFPANGHQPDQSDAAG